MKKRKRNLMKRPVRLVFYVSGCAALAVFFMLMFCPSCGEAGQIQPGQSPQQEFYEPLDNPPKSKSDSVRDNYYLLARYEPDKGLCTNKNYIENE